MTTIKLLYIHTFRDRHGKLRHTFRRPGCKKVTLPGLPGSREFMEAYQSCIDGVPVTTSPGSARTKPGSMSALIIAYYQSSEFTSLKPSTQRTYKNILDRFRDAYGSYPVAGMTPPHVRAILDKKAGTPEAANNLLKLLRQLMKFAVQRGWRSDDPTSTVGRVRHKTDGFHSWTDTEIAIFENKYPVGTKPRLMMALLLYTAQRRSDVVKMGWQHVKDGFISLSQEKTATRLEIPIHPRLKEVLDGTPREGLSFLTTSTGRPYKKESFGNLFRDLCRDAGLSHCSAHGLRKAASRRLAEAGCSAHQIMAVTGHKSLKEVVTYTAAANQKALATVAMQTVVMDGKGTGIG